jgi:hypothetical protein
VESLGGINAGKPVDRSGQRVERTSKTHPSGAQQLQWRKPYCQLQAGPSDLHHPKKRGRLR